MRYFFSIIVYFIFFINAHRIFSQDLNNLHNKKANTLVQFSEIERFYELLNQSKSSTKNNNVIHTYSITYGYMVLVESLGQTRKISDGKLEILDLIFKSFELSENIKDVFEYEVLVKTDTNLFWIPIQNTLYSFWLDEMTLRAKGLIYIRAFGSTRDSPENKWLFTINSFNSNFYDGLWEEALKSFKQKDESNGLRCVKKLIELEPKDGRNYYMYGFYFYKKGYPKKLELLKKSDSLYKIAEELSPSYGYGHYQKALTKIQLGQYIKAWDAIEKAKSLGETRIESFFIDELESKLSYKDYIKSKKLKSSNN
jgi:tetratricopeptide (TPR) repeat protein